MILFLYGENIYELNEYFHKVISKERENKNLVIKSYDGENISSINEVDLDFSIGLFGEEKLIIIKRLLSNKSTILIKKFIKFIEDSKDVKIIFWEDKNVLQTNLLLKEVRKKGKILSFTKRKYKELENWLQDYIKSNGMRINSTNLFKLIEKIGEEQDLLITEINKIKSLNINEISSDIIDSYVSSSKEYGVFEIIDKFLQKGQVENIIRTILNNPADYLIFFTLLIQQFEYLLLYYNSPILIKNLHPYVIRKLEKISKRYTIYKVKAIIKGLLEIDFQYKNGNINEMLAATLIAKMI